MVHVESSVSLVYAVVGFVVNPGWIRMVICISYNCVEKLILIRAKDGGLFCVLVFVV